MNIHANFSYNGKALQISIGAESLHPQKARNMIQDSLIEFMDDEGSNGRLLYEIMTNLKESMDVDHRYGLSDGFVRHAYHGVMVWIKLLELPYYKCEGKYHAHGKFLLFDDIQEELTRDTPGCKVDVYGFGNNEPAWCDPYILICARRKEDAKIVAERVTDKLLFHQEKCSRHCKFLS